MVSPSIQELFGMFYDAVRYMAVVRDDKGNQLKCKRANAFLPVLDMYDIFPENGNLTECEKYKKFFYSRRWEDEKYNNSAMNYKYPLFAMQWDNWKIDEMFGSNTLEKKSSKETIRFSLAVVSPYLKEKCKGSDCLKCDGRNPIEIFMDSKNILDTVLAYVKSIKRITLVNGQDESIKWITKENAEYLLSENKIDSYEVDRISTKEFIRNLTENNAENKGIPFYNETMRNLYGAVIDFDFVVKSCVTTEDKFNYSKENPKYIKDSCC